MTRSTFQVNWASMTKGIWSVRLPLMTVADPRLLEHGNANSPDLCERKEDSESVRRHPGERGRGSAFCHRHGNGVRRSWPSPEGSIRVQNARSGEHHCRHAPTLTAQSVN